MLYNSTRRIVALALAIVLVSPTFVGLMGLDIQSSAQTPTGSMGIVIPLYTDPGSIWTSIEQAKQAYPNVPFIVVINPDNGPGSSQQSDYVSGVKEMQSLGITVLGYVDTNYAAVSISSNENQINEYYNWYGVNGIMFDCMQNTVGDESYYASLNSYVDSLGMSLTMGNPGTTVPTSEVGVFNILNIYEDTGLPTLSSLSYSGYPTSDFSLIGISVSSLSTSFLSSAEGYVGYIFLTNAGLPNPYDVLPSYFTSEVAALSSLDGSDPGQTTTTTTTTSTTSSTTTTTTATTGRSVQLSVDSVNSLGNAITGYYTELYTSSGSPISSSYTPTSFTVTSGVTYEIEADSYGPCTFSHWEGGPISGSTADPAPISITSSTTLSAVYTGSSCGSQTSTSTTTTSTTSTTTTTTAVSTSTTSTTSTSSSVSITVDSVNLNGQQFSGMWTVVKEGRTVVASGYTPLTVTVAPGDTYKVTVSNYENYVFSNWASGSTDATISVVPAQNTVLTAYYNT